MPFYTAIDSAGFILSRWRQNVNPREEERHRKKNPRVRGALLLHLQSIPFLYMYICLPKISTEF